MAHAGILACVIESPAEMPMITEKEIGPMCKWDSVALKRQA